MKVIHQKERCIGCGSCVALCPKLFEMGEDGKAHLKGSKEDKEGNWIKEITPKEEKCAKEAAAACPVECIKIK